jgi:hypothetical protein
VASKAKVFPGTETVVKAGKIAAMISAIIQWVKLPTDCPISIRSLGKISTMNTQMTAPLENAKKPIY